MIFYCRRDKMKNPFFNLSTLPSRRKRPCEDIISFKQITNPTTIRSPVVNIFYNPPFANMTMIHGIENTVSDYLFLCFLSGWVHCISITYSHSYLAVGLRCYCTYLSIISCLPHFPNSFLNVESQYPISPQLTHPVKVPVEFSKLHMFMLQMVEQKLYIFGMPLKQQAGT